MAAKPISLMPPDHKEVVDIERDIEAKFIYAFRAMFAEDKQFRYNPDDVKTGIIITIEYPEKNVPFKTPHLIVHDIGYQINLNNSLLQGFDRTLYDKDGAWIGDSSTYLIPYSLSVTCVGPHSVSKDMANKIINFISFIYKPLFNNLRVNIASLSKSSARATQQYGEKIFETIIQIQGYLHWTANETIIEKSREHFIKQINTDITLKSDLKK